MPLIGFCAKKLLVLIRKSVLRLFSSITLIEEKPKDNKKGVNLQKIQALKKKA